jgi:hypothetical protein
VPSNRSGPMRAKASHKAVVGAVAAARHGVSSILEPSPHMSLAEAQTVALGITERDRVSDRVTAYVADGALRIEPRDSA